jgi:hypothetical protein
MRTFALIRDRLRLASWQGMHLTDEERQCLDEELDRAIASIAQTSTIDDANDKLLELGAMQDVLATLSFKYRIPLTDKQRKFVRQYDRWDVPEVRASIYNAIKNGNFI